MEMICRLSVSAHERRCEILLKNLGRSVQTFMRKTLHFEITILLIETSLDHLLPFPSVHLEDALGIPQIFRRLLQN